MRRQLFELRIRVGARIRPLWQRRVPDLVVSVTTFPGRVETFRLPLLSLLNQTIRAERVVVSLLSHEFPNHVVPNWLARLAKRGLIEILWSDADLRSYAKLLPVLAAYNESTVVTADDDVLYPRYWLAGLKRESELTPGAIVGYRGRPVLRRADGGMRPYTDWSPEALDGLDLSRTTAVEVMLTGVGGILYPPHALPLDVLDGRLARSLCPTADDVWFWAMELKAQVPLVVIAPGYVDFAAAAGSQANLRLMSVNVDQGANDAQITAVLEHFELWHALSAARTK